jgi:ketosteroid isomerase-like protein
MTRQIQLSMLRRKLLPGLFGGVRKPFVGDFRRLSLVVVPLFLFAFAAAGCASAPAVEVNERQALEMRQNELFAALGARNAAAVGNHFAESAVMHVANAAPIEGRAAIESFYANLFRFLDSSEMTPSVLEISREGDMAYGLGASTNVFRRGEELTSYEGKYVLVWRKFDGDWKLVLYAVSSNQAAAR